MGTRAKIAAGSKGTRAKNCRRRKNGPTVVSPYWPFTDDQYRLLAMSTEIGLLLHTPVKRTSANVPVTSLGGDGRSSCHGRPMTVRAQGGTR